MSSFSSYLTLHVNIFQFWTRRIEYLTWGSSGPSLPFWATFLNLVKHFSSQRRKQSPWQTSPDSVWKTLHKSVLKSQVPLNYTCHQNLSNITSSSSLIKNLMFSGVSSKHIYNPKLSFSCRAANRFASCLKHSARCIPVYPFFNYMESRNSRQD